MSEIEETIQALIDNGQVPARVTNRLLLAVLLDLSERSTRTEAAVRDLAERVTRIESYPSITTLLWRHPKSTIAMIALVFLLLTLAYQAGVLSLF